jgi:hypothetical protein
MFSPVQNRYGPGPGFSLQGGDVVTARTPKPGAVTKTVRRAQRQPEAKRPRLSVGRGARSVQRPFALAMKSDRCGT